METLEGNKVKLYVEVDETEFEHDIDRAFKLIAKEVTLPGFRPGKAPRKRRLIGPGARAATGVRLKIAESCGVFAGKPSGRGGSDVTRLWKPLPWRRGRQAARFRHAARRRSALPGRVFRRRR